MGDDLVDDRFDMDESWAFRYPFIHYCYYYYYYYYYYNNYYYYYYYYYY